MCYHYIYYNFKCRELKNMNINRDILTKYKVLCIWNENSLSIDYCYIIYRYSIISMVLPLLVLRKRDHNL